MMRDDKEIRRDMIRACRILDGMHLVEGFGHVSARQSEGHVVLTPARGLGLVDETELLTFDPDGGLVVGREETAPLERWMHLAIYRARPDVQAICRTHSRMAAALGVANIPVQTAHGFGGMLGHTVWVHAENDLITNDEMGRAVAVTLGANRAVLLRGNGALATGESLRQACVRAIFLEEAAALQVAAACVGGAAPFTPGEWEARSRWHAVEVDRAWEYYAAKYAGHPA